jgi:tRNA A37 threonylcarbamoyladenosine dehydratase
MTTVQLQPLDVPPLRRFGGVARLYGEQAAARLRAAHVTVVGIGGVGSWAAEALARCAVGRITLVDMDHIAESNTNRQIHALGDAYGRAKVEAMADRIAAINPACDVRAIDDFATVENVRQIIGPCDVVLDCIDQVNAKAALIAHARASGVAIITCGAAGGRFDPSRLARGDLGVIVGDPLLARVRQRLRRDYGFARVGGRSPVKFGVTAIFSDEPLARPEPACSEPTSAPSGGLACSGYGSTVVVTATMGFWVASEALATLAAGNPGGRQSRA